MSNVNCYVRNESTNTYYQEIISAPKVIHNRGLHFSKSAKRELEHLINDGFVIFNSWNRYRKLETYEVLSEDEELKPYLPETKKATNDTILERIKKYRKVIVKPDSGNDILSSLVKKQDVCLFKMSLDKMESSYRKVVENWVSWQGNK